MNRTIFTLALSTLILGGCASLPEKAEPVVREFDAQGISEVVLRASAAETAVASYAMMDKPFVSITAVPTISSRSYHSSETKDKQTRPGDLGLSFASRRHGSTLVISARREIDFIHHQYTLERISILLPESVRLVRDVRLPSSDGRPDLSPP